MAAFPHYNNRPCTCFGTCTCSLFTYTTYNTNYTTPSAYRSYNERAERRHQKNLEAFKKASDAAKGKRTGWKCAGLEVVAADPPEPVVRVEVRAPLPPRVVKGVAMRRRWR